MDTYSETLRQQRAVSQDCVGIEGKHTPISIKEQVTHFLALLIVFHWVGEKGLDNIPKPRAASRQSSLKSQRIKISNNTLLLAL